MKILVYYLMFDARMAPIKEAEVIEAKLQDLKKKFPSFTNQIMVLPHYDRSGDRIEMVDMTPNYSYPNTLAGPIYTTHPNYYGAPGAAGTPASSTMGGTGYYGAGTTGPYLTGAGGTPLYVGNSGSTGYKTTSGC